MASITKFPRSESGRMLLKHALKYDGVRDLYPDGTSYRTTDWDEIAEQCDAIFADLIADERAS